MKHPDHIVDFDGTLKEAARAVANMRYDKVSEFFHELQNAFYEDARKDSAAGHPQLYDKLSLLSLTLQLAEEDANRAWKICKEKMNV